VRARVWIERERERDKERRRKGERKHFRGGLNVIVNSQLDIKR